MDEHDDDCTCAACEAEAEELRALLLGAVESGRISERDLLDSIISSTERPEMVAMVEDYRLQQGEIR